MKRIWVIVLIVFGTTSEAVEAADWPMVQRDAVHSGFSPRGPGAPLKKAWHVETDDPENSFTTWPVLSNDSVIARSGRGALSVDAATGRRKWLKEQKEGSLIIAPAIHEGAIAMPLPDRLVGLSRDSGEELWSFPVGDDLGIPTIANGRIFVGSHYLEDERAFYSLDALTGQLIWKVSSRFPPHTVPAISAGKVIVTSDDIDSDRGELIALDEATGKELWKVSAEATKNSPAVLGNKVILGGGDLFAHAYDIDSGKELWRSAMNGRFDSQNTAALAFGDVFLADRIGNIYRLDGETGQRKWVWGREQGLSPGGFSQQFPVIGGKTLYIGNGAGWLYALNTDTGQLLWKHQVGGFVYSGAVDEERFYFGVKFKNEGLYAFEHDPQGKLEAPPSRPSVTANLLSGLLIFGLVILAVAAAVRYRRAQQT